MIDISLPAGGNEKTGIERTGIITKQMLLTTFVQMVGKAIEEGKSEAYIDGIKDFTDALDAQIGRE